LNALNDWNGLPIFLAQLDNLDGGALSVTKYVPSLT
jgi:hypothetical protein